MIKEFKTLKVLLTNVCLISGFNFIAGENVVFAKSENVVFAKSDEVFNKEAICIETTGFVIRGTEYKSFEEYEQKNVDKKSINFNKKEDQIWEKVFNEESVILYACNKGIKVFEQIEKTKEEQTLGFRFNKNNLGDIVKEVNKISKKACPHDKNVLALMIFNLICGNKTIDFTNGIDDIIYAFKKYSESEDVFNQKNSQLEKKYQELTKRLEEKNAKLKSLREQIGEEWDKYETFYPNSDKNFDETLKGGSMILDEKSLESQIEVLKQKSEKVEEEILTLKSSFEKQQKDALTLQGSTYIAGFIINDLLKHSLYFSNITDDDERFFCMDDSIVRLWNLIADKFPDKREVFDIYAKAIVNKSVKPLFFGKEKINKDETIFFERINYSLYGKTINSLTYSNIKAFQSRTKKYKTNIEKLKNFLSFFQNDVTKCVDAFRQDGEKRDAVINILKKEPAKIFNNKNIVIEANDVDLDLSNAVLYLEDQHIYIFHKNCDLNNQNIKNKFETYPGLENVYFGVLYNKFLSATENEFVHWLDTEKYGDLNNPVERERFDLATLNRNLNSYVENLASNLGDRFPHFSKKVKDNLKLMWYERHRPEHFDTLVNDFKNAQKKLAFDMIYRKIGGSKAEICKYEHFLLSDCGVPITFTKDFCIKALQKCNVFLEDISAYKHFFDHELEKLERGNVCLKNLDLDEDEPGQEYFVTPLLPKEKEEQKLYYHLAYYKYNSNEEPAVQVSYFFREDITKRILSDLNLEIKNNEKIVTIRTKNKKEVRVKLSPINQLL